MAYRKSARKSSARRSHTRRAAPRARKSGVRRAGRASGIHTVKLVIQHETAAMATPGGLDMPQVQTQTKKAKF